MARPHNLLGPGVRLDQLLNRDRPIGRRDTGGDPISGVDRNGKCGRQRPSGPDHHHRNVQLVESPPEHRHADQAAALARHEIHLGRPAELSRNGEIAFVLAILVVDDEHEAAGLELGDRVRDGGEVAQVFRVV